MHFAQNIWGFAKIRKYAKMYIFHDCIMALDFFFSLIIFLRNIAKMRLDLQIFCTIIALTVILTSVLFFLPKLKIFHHVPIFHMQV